MGSYESELLAAGSDEFLCRRTVIGKRNNGWCRQEDNGSY